MADFTVHIPDTFVARPTTVAAVDERIAGIANLDVVKNKLLPWLGVSDIASLTPKQKAEIICQVHLWELEARVHVRDEGQAARVAAMVDSLDNFNPGT